MFSCLLNEISIFTLWLIWSHPRIRNNGGHKIYNFDTLVLGHHYYTPSLSDLSIGVEQMFKEIMHFTIWLYYGHALAQEPLVRGSWNLVDPFLVIIIIYSMCLIYVHFLLNNYFPLWWRFMKFTISCPLALQMLHIKFS